MPGCRWSADIVFAAIKLAVFVDGCYWHGCDQHGTTAKTNSLYWKLKIERNKARDASVDAALRAAGWLTVRVWEHEKPWVAAENLKALVAERRQALKGR